MDTTPRTLLGIRTIGSLELGNFALASLLMAVVLVANGQVMLGLFRLWAESATYSHGFLVLPAAAYAWYRLRDDVDRAATTARPAGALALAALVLALVFCQASFLLTGSAALLPLVLLAAVYAALGGPVSRLAVVPVLLLYCAMPVWSVVVPHLQVISAVVSAAVASLFGVLLVRTGTTIQVASGVFEVEPGCSGMNFLLCSLTVALLLGELNALRLRGRALLLGTAIMVAFIANWFRIVTLVVLGDWTRMQHYLVAGEHYTFGWMAFVVALLGWMFAATRIIARASDVAFVAPSTGATALANRPRKVGTLVAAAIVAAAALWGTEVRAPESAAIPSLRDVLPDVEGWNGPEPASLPWMPIFAGADAEWQAGYARSQQQVFVYRNAFVTEEPGKELVSSQNRFVPSDWESSERYSNAQRFTSPAGEEWVVSSWLVVGGTVVDGDVQAKFLQAANRLRGVPRAAGTVVVATRCETASCSEALSRLDDFLAAAQWPRAAAFADRNPGSRG